jgi:hypothetical protein
MKRLLLIIVAVLTALCGWSQNKFEQGSIENYTVQLKSGEANNAKYTWLVTPANGTSTNLSSIDVNNAQIVWDGPIGFYNLSVQVVDGNGCVSESISQEIEIISSGELFFTPTFPNTTVCSDLAGGMEGSVPNHSQSLFRISYGGDANLVSAQITIENPDGEFIGLDGAVLPNQLYPWIRVDNTESDKQIDFAVSDSWENNSSQLVDFEIKLISGETSNPSETPEVSGTGNVRTISVLAKPVLEFQ